MPKDDASTAARPRELGGETHPSRVRALAPVPRDEAGDPAPDARPDRAGAWLPLAGAAAAALWIGGSAAYLFGYYAGVALSEIPPAQIAGVAMVVAAPALLFALAGFLGREVARAAARGRAMEQALLQLTDPGRRAEDGVRTLAGAVSVEIDRVNAAMESALARLAAMEEVIAHHAETLETTTAQGRERAEDLVTNLRRERERIADVADSLDDKAALIAAAIQDQSRMVAAAAELAEARVKDAEDRLDAAAEGLRGAGEAVADAGDRAAEAVDLRARHLTQAAESLSDRTSDLEKAYQLHADRMREAGDALQAEHGKIAAAFDFHKAELDAMTRTAGEGADRLRDAASDGAAAFTTAVESAIARAQDLADAVRRESEEAARDHEKALARLEIAAEAARAAADEAATRFAEQAETAEETLERINEAGFKAGRLADDRFQERLEEARTLTQRAQEAADSAGEAVRKRLTETIESAKRESERIERILAEHREALAGAPETARETVRAIEEVMKTGLDEIVRSAADASESTKEIDALFQARVRQNYELLSDFMLRMGAVAGGRKPLEIAADEVPDPFSSRAPQPRPASETGDTPPDDAAGAGRAEPQPDASSASAGSDAQSRADERRAAGGWRWKDLLANMDAENADAPAEGGSDETPRARARRRNDR